MAVITRDWLRVRFTTVASNQTGELGYRSEEDLGVVGFLHERVATTVDGIRRDSSLRRRLLSILNQRAPAIDGLDRQRVDIAGALHQDT